MIENDLLKNTSDDIAQFLYKGEGLNKTAIGDYLGERSGWMLFFPLSFSVESYHIHVDDTITRAYFPFLAPGHTHPFPKSVY